MKIKPGKNQRFKLGDAKDLIKGFFGEEPSPTDNVIDSNRCFKHLNA